ncbi:MAG TPA: BTAD domain-containing putative transcriptional regulator [Chloroflexota bacterium]|jgi:DNA-binding SARP family transcriptional activator
MRDGTSIDMLGAPAGVVQVVEGRVLAELHALRSQVATLQQLVLQREPRWSAPFALVAARGLDAAAGADEPPLFATFFGSFTVYRGRRRLAIGSSRPVCELGTYLMAHAGKSIARDALMDLLWPEVDPARAAHRLHVAVSDLRRVVDAPGLTSLVRLQDDSYHIAACSVATDCELFEQHYQHGKRCQTEGDKESAGIAFQAALQLYTGEFLADHPYLEWAAQKRAHYAERHLGALTALCEGAAHRRDFDAVEEYARAILDVDNLREQAHRHLMRAHYYLGRRASAIRQYRACAKDLERELGAAPSLLTQQLHDAICRDHELPGEIGPTD